MAILASLAILALAGAPADDTQEQFCHTLFIDKLDAYLLCMEDAEPKKTPLPVSTEEWEARTVTPMNWSRLALGDGVVVLTKPGPTHAPPNRMIWSRWERRYPGKVIPPTLSTVSLDEVECTTGRIRSVQSSAYANNNMSGSGDTQSASSAWEYPVPDSLLSAVAKKACAK